MSTRRPRIFIDGYNLALEQGTGVATYARNLSFGLRDLGADVGVLYGTHASTISVTPSVSSMITRVTSGRGNQGQMKISLMKISLRGIAGACSGRCAMDRS